MDEPQAELMASPQLSSCDSWDTWEELLLASAVKKHGTDKWGLVSAELRARASARNASPSTFTPEACRSEYYVLRGRYSKEDDREGNLSNDMPWFEELRKLRVAQLKKELEHYDNSIGSLEIKLKRLKSEREKNFKIGGKQLGETGIGPETEAYKADAARSISSSDALSTQTCGRRSEDLVLDRQAPREVYGFSKLATGHIIEEERHRQGDGLQGTVPEEVEEDLKTSESTLKCSEAVPLVRDVVQNVNVECSGQDRYPQEDAGIIQGVASSEKRSHPVQGEGERKAVAALSIAKDVGAVIKNSVETLAGSREISLSSQPHKSSDLNAANREDYLHRPEAENGTVTRNHAGDDCGAKPVVSQAPPEAMDIKTGGGESEERAKFETRASLPHKHDDGHSNSGIFVASEGRSLPKPIVPVRTPFSTLDNNQEGSETVNSPRLKHMFLLKNRRGTDGGTVLKAGSTDKEACRLDDDHKNVICRVLGDKTVPEHKHRLPIESADSTEDKQQEDVPSVSESKKSWSQAPASRKERAQRLLSEAASKSAAFAEILGSHHGLASRELDTDSKPSNFDVQNPSISSTENSELREVWGESAEVVDDKTEPVKKKQRVTGWGKKRKLKKSITKDLASTIRKEAMEVTNSAKETCVKMESMTASHEGSMHDRDGKEADEHDMEAWHQMERFSGDSRVERSEVGSFVDGNEDISPMSRRNRREPKVSRKLIPLLESLRTIVAHKFAPLFKHSQESQDNPRYDRLIRAHVDLGMIRARLEEGQYSGSLQFFRDLLLMVNNALVYYPRDTQEFVAATGLRECIVKEMAHVLETEALLKQEGPSIRRRESKMALDAPKAAGQPLPGKEAKRKGFERPAVNDLTSRDTAMNSRDDVVANVGSRDLSGNENLALGFTEATMPTKGTADTHDLQLSGPDAEIGAQNEGMRGHKLSDESRKGHFSTEPTGEVEEVRQSVKAPVKESKDRERRVDSRDPLVVNRQGVLAKAASVSKASSATALNKGVEISAPKIHATRVQKPETPHETVKRGVGRPPKHSQPQVSQKAKEAEVPNPRRKWVRR